MQSSLVDPHAESICLMSIKICYNPVYEYKKTIVVGRLY